MSAGRASRWPLIGEVTTRDPSATGPPVGSMWWREHSSVHSATSDSHAAGDGRPSWKSPSTAIPTDPTLAVKAWAPSTISPDVPSGSSLRRHS